MNRSIKEVVVTKSGRKRSVGRPAANKNVTFAYGTPKRLAGKPLKIVAMNGADPSKAWLLLSRRQAAWSLSVLPSYLAREAAKGGLHKIEYFLVNGEDFYPLLDAAVWKSQRRLEEIKKVQHSFNTDGVYISRKLARDDQ